MRVVAISSLVLTFIASKAYADDSILHNFKEFPPLPTVQQTDIQTNGVTEFTNATQGGQGSLNLNNIQADVLTGMRKDKQLFLFFAIKDANPWKQKKNELANLITSTAALLSPQFKTPYSINVAFSATGLKALGVTSDLKDAPFAGGQFADASNLGDPGTVNWNPVFKGTTVHGLFLIASNDWAQITKGKGKINSLLGNGIASLYELQGQVRPGNQAGHEHFGFMDGISQPAVNGFTTTPFPGQISLDPGFFLLGEKGDTLIDQRPAWAKDGSFLAFRQLKQLVPEFDKFVKDEAAANGMPADLLGARIIGRWKSGAPIDLSPTQDNATLAADPMLNNNFDFTHPNSDILTDQSRCPFTAHIRKTAPRADFTPVNTQNHIIRAGLPFGPEVSYDEAASNTTKQERGLAFISYQSQIGLGFQFIQKLWADNPNFFFNKNISAPGADPLIGQLKGAPRNVTGLVPAEFNRVITFQKEFIVSQGGEYFFTPAIKAIRDGFPN